MGHWEAGHGCFGIVVGEQELLGINNAFMERTQWADWLGIYLGPNGAGSLQKNRLELDVRDKGLTLQERRQSWGNSGISRQQFNWANKVGKKGLEVNLTRGEILFGAPHIISFS